MKTQTFIYKQEDIIKLIKFHLKYHNIETDMFTDSNIQSVLVDGIQDKFGFDGYKITITKKD